jgi:hypothetical protein
VAGDRVRPLCHQLDRRQLIISSEWTCRYTSLVLQFQCCARI